MTKRAFNFSAGPAVLPLPVLERIRDNLLSYHGLGYGVMEMSHRSSEYEEILHTTVKNFTELLSLDDSYVVLFTTGGATQQSSMVPMNLLEAGKCADYIITGYWAEKAYKEAKKFGEIRVAATSQDKDFSYIPQEVNVSKDASYVHMTSNNTIYGTQFTTEPNVGQIPLVCDASSDLLHKKIDIKKYALIYAGAQKNLGPAGVTVVIMRKDLLKRSPANLPVLMDYNSYANAESMHNTPPTFPIYVVGEVLKWIKDEGGLVAIEARNRKKAAILYQMIDSSEFYRGTAEKEARSVMNVTFRLSSEELEKKFVAEAKAAGLAGLKGHKRVGGIRASIYNAFPTEGVEALVVFMKDFESRHR